MRIQHFTKKDYVTTAWSGGKTSQLAIMPEKAVYADRDFLWRISSATVELEESEFTALPDYNRLILPLQGDITLCHEDETQKLVLAPFDVYAFDGAARTHSWGQCVDFNLMLRKGEAEGNVQILNLSAESQAALSCAAPAAGEMKQTFFGFYCAEGSCQVAAGCAACGEADETAASERAEDETEKETRRDGVKLQVGEFVLLSEIGPERIPVETEEGAVLVVVSVRNK